MSTRQTFLLEYEVNVTGLEQAANSANMAREAADNAALGLRHVERLGTSNLSIMLMATRSVNAFRLAVEQAAKGVRDLNPVALLYSFLNIVQVIRNLAALTRMLTGVTWAQGAALAFVQTLAGNWWLIPLAVAAVAAVWGLARSSEAATASRGLQKGGVVREEGWYYLHPREIVINPELTRETLITKEVIHEKPPPEVIVKPELIKETLITREIIHRKEPPEIIVKPEVTKQISITREISPHYGPIFVTFEKQPTPGIDTEDFLRSLGSRLAEEVRRGGY